jgi:uncharacterized membrane protein
VDLTYKKIGKPIDDLNEGEYFYDTHNLKKNVNFKTKSHKISVKEQTTHFKNTENILFEDILIKNENKSSPIKIKKEEKKETIKVKAAKHSSKENMIKGDDLLNMLDL